MSLTKAEVRAAFREAAVRSYAHIPPDEEIDHVFSESFYRRMDALIKEERRGSWRLLSQRHRHALVVAAILAAALLLTACTPKLREAVTEFVVSVYERFVDYGTALEVRKEIETVYVLDPIPLDFEFVSQTHHGSFLIETLYQSSQGTALIFKQGRVTNLGGTADNEHGKNVILTIDGDTLPVLVYSSKTLTIANWFYDGYYMKISYYGELNHADIESLISAVSPG